MLVRLSQLFCLIWLMLAGVVTICAEKMPIRHLTVADGLPQNTIRFVHQDRQGFFWIGTDGGLARFDGYDFVNFTKQTGLPRNEIFDFLEIENDCFWLATKGGLVKFSPDGKIYDRVITNAEAAALEVKPAFVTFAVGNAKTPAITKLLRASNNQIWIGTENGLFQMRENNGEIEFPEFNLNLPPSDSRYVHQLCEDRDGAIWIGTNNNLTRISPTNLITNYRDETAVVFSAMRRDRAGNLWIGTQHKGLFLFDLDERETPRVKRRFAAVPDSEIEWIDQIIEAADGEKLFIGGTNGIFEFYPGTGKLLRYTRASGLGFNRYQIVFEDRGGNLWLGTRTGGVFRIAAQGLISFDTDDRISFVRSVGLDKNKNLLLTAFVTNTELDAQGAKVERGVNDKAVAPFDWRLGNLAENKFSWLVPKFSRQILFYGWGNNQLSLQSRTGEWWIVTGAGLFRFPAVEFSKLAETAPTQIFDEKTGLNPPSVYKIFEDSRGDLWIATSGEQSNGFYQWERRAETLRDLRQTHGYANKNLITAFAEDAAGNLWFAAGEGVGRFRAGKIEFFQPNQINALPPGGVSALFFDSKNRLWAAMRQGGAARFDDPFAETPQSTVYTENQGLSSNRTLSLTEDRNGLIYIGTDRDINRLNPVTHEFKVLRLGKNQLQREYRSAVCDGDGVLWFGTTEGLIKYVPQTEKPSPPPEILITGVQIEGAAQNVSATGAAEIKLPTLAPQQNQIRIDYVSLANFENENIAYQYKFADDAEWSQPTRERFVNFANLSWGNYRVSVRAVASGENISAKSAVVAFEILAPVYLRSWFLILTAIGGFSAVYFWYRYRVRKLLEMERARTLIATDLHDDIGSNLSKISVLSEVVRMRMSGDSEQNRLLNSIAEISRESIGSMSDIVWAINPKRDSLAEMLGKMRAHAEQSLSPQGIKVIFNEPETVAAVKLPMHIRRDLYLIFKEAVNNIAKHSRAETVEISLRATRGAFVLELKDDGRGFDSNQETGGNGLLNMQNRVAKLKGDFEITSQINRGTNIKIRVPQN